jgi:hypothetical protein
MFHAIYSKNIMQKIVGIYKITSPSGKVYIGQSWDIADRWKQYRRYACKNQPKIYNSLKKYTHFEHIFEIVETFESNIEQDYLDDCETTYIDEYKYNGYTMLNIRGGGRGGKHSQESKDKLSETVAVYVYTIQQKFKPNDTTKSISKYCSANGYNYDNMISTLYGLDKNGQIYTNIFGTKILNRVRIDCKQDIEFNIELERRTKLYQDILQFELNNPQMFVSNFKPSIDKLSKQKLSKKFVTGNYNYLIQDINDKLYYVKDVYRFCLKRGIDMNILNESYQIKLDKNLNQIYSNGYKLNEIK